MRQIGFGHLRMIPSGTAASLGNKPASEFEGLSMPLVSSAYNLARWLARNDQDAEDLVQETYLKAFRNFNSFESGTNFRAWIFRILRNTFINSRATAEWRLTFELNAEEEFPCSYATCTTPESLLIKSSEIASIRAAIEQLPFALRELILLRDVEGLTYKEITEILEIPMGTVMSRLARARKVIRDTLLPPQIDHYREPVSLH